VTAMASAASGDASPRDFISFLLSRNSVPLLSGLVRGLMRSVFRNLSVGNVAGSEPVTHGAPHLCALVAPHDLVLGFVAEVHAAYLVPLFL
jgi:hypothetical protein